MSISPKEEAVRSLKMRLKRGTGFKIEAERHLCNKLLEEYSDDELEYLIFIFAPIVPLIPGYSRRADFTKFAAVTEKKKMQGMMRANLFTSINMYYASPKTKKLFLNILARGTGVDAEAYLTETIKDTIVGNEKGFSSLLNYTQTITIAREIIEFDRKKDKLDINFKTIIQFFNDEIKLGGNIFLKMARSTELKRTDKNYIFAVRNKAATVVKNMNDIINIQVNPDAAVSSNPFWINGRMSKFRKKGKDDPITYEEQGTNAVIEQAIIMGYSIDSIREALDRYQW